MLQELNEHAPYPTKALDPTLATEQPGKPERTSGLRVVAYYAGASVVSAVLAIIWARLVIIAIYTGVEKIGCALWVC